MTHFCPTSRKRVARLLLAATAASPAVHAAGLPDASYYISGDDGAYDRVVERDGTLSRTTSPDVVAFATADDATAFATLWRQAYTTVVPDARLIAAAFVHDTLGIDGEAYVVAHFATAEDRSRGVPDRTQSLVDALMEAFPDHSRHAWFPLAADAVGGVMGGGEQSPGLVRLGDQLARASDVKDVFRTLGSFLWSRTGPGYVYNTLFAKGNVRETVGEDWRALDEAFGIYRVGGFTAEYRSHLTLSQLVESFGAPTAFAELPYVKEVKRKLDAYWQASQSSWPLLARYEFVRQARHAHERGLLTDIEYERVMLGGAPRVPLTGPITLAQLGPSLPGADVDARRFDINGYAASNLVRFVARDGSEVMYIPGGDPAFVVAGSERELRQWVLQQARDRRKLDDLLLHFSTYAGQDGVFWTGVKHGLENVGNGQWQADAHAIDHTSAVIAGDVFEDMRKQSEERLRDDARMQMATAWEAWRTTINRGVAVASPLGFVPLFSMPVQVITGVASAGTGLDQELDGRTTDERKAGAEQVLTTAIYNLPIGALFGGMRKGDATKEGGIAFVPPKRVNGKIGYPLSPMTPPSWRTTTVNRLYRRLDGSIARWVAADVPGQTISRFPANGAARPDGMYVRDDELFVPWSNTGRVARVVASGSRYRFLFKNKAVGPIVERGSGDAWELATDAQAYVKGSVLAHLVPDRLTVDPRALHRAAQVLEQWGSSEAAVQAPGAAHDPGSLSPLVMLSLGHGFIETLSARLRDPAGTEWSSSESWLLGPTIARQLRRPVALFREDGTLEWAAAEDGTEPSAAQLPPRALRLQRHEASYVVLGPVRLLRKFPTLLFAAAEANRAPGSMEPSTGVEREIAFRKALADAIDVRSTRLELERVHQLWIQRMGLPPRELQLLIALSRLRHAIFHGDPLTAAQEQRLRAAGGAELRAAIDANARNWRELAKGVLAKLFDEESALLPTGLGHLLVQDAATLSSARYQASDQWTEGGRHYVRLRHLDGRTQVVETAAEQGDQRGAYREILVPTASANRETGRYVVDRGGMWYPEPELRDGLAPVDPREYAETLASVAARWPAVTRDDFSLGKRIVDSIPQPLLRYFAAPLTAVDMGDDTGFLLTIRHPGSGSLKRFMTRVDMAGNALPPVRPVDAGPAPSGAIAADTQLALPVPEGVGIVRFGPRPDPAIFIDLLRADSPISAFIEAGIGNRHIRTLVTTRRLRGMLREDSHLAIVGATPEHAFTLLMPVNTETISLVRPGGSTGNLVTDLPAGTVIVDEMFGVRATAADYPARVRAVARQWESAGGRIRKVLRNGSEERESPVAFVERMLSSPVRPNLWNPSKDPISETAYVDYMRGRHANGQAVRHAGLDWLETRQARRDYMAYFAPPHDALPDGTAPPANDLAASNMYELAETAIDASLRPIAVPARPPAPRP